MWAEFCAGLQGDSLSAWLGLGVLSEKWLAALNWAPGDKAEGMDWRTEVGEGPGTGGRTRPVSCPRHSSAGLWSSLFCAIGRRQLGIARKRAMGE